MINWDVIRHIRANKQSPHLTPVSMQINITGRCPCRCWHCEKAVSRNGKDLDWSTLMTNLDQAQEWGCSVLYTGGEPLVHHRWRDLLRSGMERGLKQKLITSGIGFPKLCQDDRQLLCDSLDELMVSVDSADSVTHDQLRGCDGLFTGIMEFLAKRPRPKNIWLIHVPQPDLQSVGPMLTLAAQHAVGLIVQPYIFISNFPHLQALTSKANIPTTFQETATQAATNTRKFVKMARQLGVVSNLEEVALFIEPYYSMATSQHWYGRKILPKFICSVPWQQVTIDEYGQIQPCVFLKGQAIAENSNLADHWHEQALQFRVEQMAGITWPECNSCSCHFSSNYKNSLLMFPWVNRPGWGIAVRKKLMRSKPFATLLGRS